MKDPLDIQIDHILEQAPLPHECPRCHSTRLRGTWFGGLCLECGRVIFK